MNIFKKNILMLKYAARFAPEMIIIKIVLSLTGIIVNFGFNIFFLKYVVDSMEYGGSFLKVLLFIGVLGGIVLIDGLLSSFFSQIISPKCINKIRKGMHCLIFNKIRLIELEKFDNADFYNEYIWVLNESDGCVIQSFNIIFSFFSNTITAVLFSSITLTYDPTLFIFSVIPIFVNIVLNNINSKLSVKKQEETVPINRRETYAQRVMYLQQYAKELRLYPSMNDRVIKTFENSIDEKNEIIRKYGNKTVPIDFVANNFQFFFGVLLMAIYISYRVIVQGTLSAGIFVAMFTAVNNFAYSIGAIFNCIPQLTKNALLSDKVYKMLSYKSEIEEDNRKDEDNTKINFEFKSIIFDHVCFRYPDTEEYVLKDVSFEIKKNDRIAFVGLNGAGKTTIIKLMLRLYDPTEGEIKINGQNIKNIGINAYRRLFRVIFQDFQLYAFCLGDNVLMDEFTEQDISKVIDCLKKSDLIELQDSVRVPVTREFDSQGLIPSGGQAQKIALARALAHSGDIMVMDEASSALDPISEYNINKTIVNSSDKSTLVIVSHRLATVQYVNKIFYLEEGVIKETGTHKDLIEMRGKYYEMYQKQAESYRI